MGNYTMAARMERRERVRGRHADLLSRAESTAIRCQRGSASGMDATIVRQLLAVIAQQEIELRQAVRDKCARPVAELI